jgi:ABC-type uncharacterized transport system YnjBCD permease subunit
LAEESLSIQLVLMLKLSPFLLLIRIFQLHQLRLWKSYLLHEEYFHEEDFIVLSKINN